MNQVRLERVSSESGTQSEQVHPWAEITAAETRITAPRSRDVPAGIRAKQQQGRPCGIRAEEQQGRPCGIRAEEQQGRPCGIRAEVQI